MSEPNITNLGAGICSSANFLSAQACAAFIAHSEQAGYADALTWRIRNQPAETL